MGVPDGARRLAFVVLALALAGAAVFAFLQAGTAGVELEREARRSSERAAEAVASTIATEDIDGSMASTRAASITSVLERRLLEPSESVTIWNADAVVVYAEDQSLIGTQDRRLRDRISRVLANGTQTEVADGSLHTFVPVPIGEGEGTLVLAEVIRPDDELASAGRPWIYASVASVLLALLAFAAALRTPNGYPSRSSGFSGAELRREHRNVMIAERALEQARALEAKLKEELERVTGDLRESQDALSAKDATIGEAESKLRAAGEQTARAEAELRAGATMRDEAARLIETELQVALSERNSLIADREAITAARDAAMAELDALRATQDATSGELEATRANLEVITREMAELRARYEGSTARAAHAEARVLDLRAALRELEDRPDLTGELETAGTELETVREDQAAVTAELETFRAEHDRTRSELETTQGTPDSIPAQHMTTSAALDEARKELSASKAALGSARLELEGATSNTRRAAAEAGEARSAFDAVSADLSTAHEETEAAWAEATALTKRMDEHVQRATHAEAKVFELSQRIQDLEFRPDLTPALEDARSALEAARSDLRDRDAQVAEARNELVAVRTSLRSANARVEEVEASIAKLRAEKDALKNGVTKASTLAGQQEARTGGGWARSDPASADHELADLRRELELARATAKELPRRNEELQEQVEALTLRAEAEAAKARSRPPETQASLAQLQDAVEQGAEPAVPSISPIVATEVVDALSLDAERSLSVIFGRSRALSSHQQGRDDGRLPQQLMTQAKRMEHAIDDILDADQLTRGEPVLQRRNTEIDTLVRRVVREFPFAGDRALEVAVETATIHVDPARVERLIDDLLTSAVARTSAGDRIVLRLERTEDGVLISVEDGKAVEGDWAAGAAAAFLAKLHGGWARGETLPNGTGVVRAFIPGVLNAPRQGDAQAAAALG